MKISITHNASLSCRWRTFTHSYPHNFNLLWESKLLVKVLTSRRTRPLSYEFNSQWNSQTVNGTEASLNAPTLDPITKIFLITQPSLVLGIVLSNDGKEALLKTYKIVIRVEASRM